MAELLRLRKTSYEILLILLLHIYSVCSIAMHAINLFLGSFKRKHSLPSRRTEKEKTKTLKMTHF